MARSTEFREPAASQIQNRREDRTKSKLWPRMKWVMMRTIFWSYERGSWQYDIIVLAILAFIFITPSSWFYDRPQLQLSDLRHVQGIVEVRHTSQNWAFQIDSRLVDSLLPLAPQDAVRQLLRQRVDGPFVIKSLEPILDKNGVVLGYTVSVGRR